MKKLLLLTCAIVSATILTGCCNCKCNHRKEFRNPPPQHFEMKRHNKPMPNDMQRQHEFQDRKMGKQRF